MMKPAPPLDKIPSGGKRMTPHDEANDVFDGLAHRLEANQRMPADIARIIADASRNAAEQSGLGVHQKNYLATVMEYSVSIRGAGL